MDKLLELLARRHRNAAANSYPSSEKICDFSRQLMNLLFPEHKGKTISSANLLKDAMDTLRDQLAALLSEIQPALPEGPAVLAGRFMEQLPGTSEERRVGKEWVSTCRSGWSP